MLNRRLCSHWLSPQLATEAGWLRGKPSRLRAFLILLPAFLVVIGAASATIYLTLNHYWQGVLGNEITRSLTEKAHMFAARVDTDKTHRIDEITSEEGQYAGARATVVDGNGQVVADSEIPVRLLENEGQTPEFKAALRGETGIKVRRRGAFGTQVLFVAVPVSGGAVRLAYPLSDVGIAAGNCRQPRRHSRHSCRVLSRVGPGVRACYRGWSSKAATVDPRRRLI